MNPTPAEQQTCQQHARRRKSLANKDAPGLSALRMAHPVMRNVAFYLLMRSLPGWGAGSRIMSGMQRRHHPVSLEQAAEEAPVLSLLMQKTRLSQQCAQSISEMVPAPLRPYLAYGQIDEGEWCILVQGNAIAAKVKHLLPLWLNRLQQQGYDVQRIRLRLQGAPASPYR